jgi:hypothetical protein
MIKLPLSAFENLALNEIKHIVDVMRDADVEESEDSNNNNNTIKRAPHSKSKKSKKKEQQAIYENDIDTNNNTLKRTNDYENILQVAEKIEEDNTLQSKQERSTASNGIPSVPRVHMGAGFMKIFNQCPLEIHSSYCWMNSETRGETMHSR